MKKLAVLDFDGTIYNGDSMLDFARFLNEKTYKRSLFRISGIYILTLLGLVNRNRLKAKFLKINFTGKPKDLLESKGVKFYQIFQSRLMPNAIKWIEKFQSEGHDIIIISGSCKEWLLPFCKALNSDLISTELAYKNDLCTGKWASRNLTGEQKKIALKEYLKGKPNYDYIIAFGDKKSDKELKPVVNEYHHRYF